MYSKIFRILESIILCIELQKIYFAGLWKIIYSG